MAKGFKTGGRDFVKGQIANPRGPKKLPEGFSEIKKLTSAEVVMLMNKYSNMTLEELKELLEKKEKLSVLDAMIISVLTKSFEQGDQNRFQFILDRMIGTVKQQVDLSNEDGSMKQKAVIILPDNGRE